MTAPDTAAIRIEGFVIVPPVSPWDKSHRDQIWAYLSPNTFGTTPAEAWRRHHPKPDLNDAGTFSQHVQHWFGRGYRVQRAAMEIYPEAEGEEE